MTSGICTRHLRYSLLLLLIPPCLAAAADPDPAALVSGMKRDLPARTAYTEVRFAQMFDKPIIARGELEYLGPGRLGKRVDSPYKETMSIADGEVHVQRGERKPRQISLGQIPELEGFLRGFSALLGGDSAALARDFSLSTSGNEQRWKLVLTPKDQRLKRRIKAIEVDGAGNSARCFSVLDADGDASIMRVEALAAEDLPKPLTRTNMEITCRRGSSAS